MTAPTINRINPNATVITAGERTWYFSYQTCVAYRVADKQFRRDRNYSVTTAKHLNYMGVADWPRVDDATFEKIAGGDNA